MSFESLNSCWKNCSLRMAFFKKIADFRRSSSHWIISTLCSCTRGLSLSNSYMFVVETDRMRGRGQGLLGTAPSQSQTEVGVRQDREQRASGTHRVRKGC